MARYRINEIFYSLQGEGRNVGRAAVFVRFAGCNLQCSFCDTDFSSYREMSEEDVVDAVVSFPARFVVLTGGEPTLQLTSSLVDSLHRQGVEVAIETNGTRVPLSNIDWVTVSPKEHPVVTSCNELKCIFTGEESVNDFGIKAEYYYLQPCDTGDAVKNRLIIETCVEYIKQHPKWRLSLQTHKLVGFP